MFLSVEASLKKLKTSYIDIVRYISLKRGGTETN
jgi:aryl-alcohol dehydrogenase-like predicted oxidoreductase